VRLLLYDTVKPILVDCKKFLVYWGRMQGAGIGTHVVVKVNTGTISVIESSCHLLLQV